MPFTKANLLPNLDCTIQIVIVGEDTIEAMLSSDLQLIIHLSCKSEFPISLVTLVCNGNKQTYCHFKVLQE